MKNLVSHGTGIIIMAGINFEYVDLWLAVKHAETGDPQYQEQLDEAIEAWFRYLASWKNSEIVMRL